MRSFQGAAAAFVPAGVFGLPPRHGLLGTLAGDSPVQRLPNGDYHLHPNYRMPLPLDPLLLKTQAGLDDFVNEKYAEQIAAILSQWSAALRRSPSDVAFLEKLLLPDFAGASLRPEDSQVVRSKPIEVRRNKFKSAPTLNREAFLADLKESMNAFSGLRVAELQVTSIEVERPASQPVERRASSPVQRAAVERRASSPVQSEAAANIPSQLKTRIRYELAGQTPDLALEQRIGEWDLLWQSDSSAEFRVHSWCPVEETQSRSAAPAFADITEAALGDNPSFHAQLAHGGDYWRTVLDSACGIDIYGHNGISVGDIDGDGWDDLYICQPGGLPNRLYRNRGDGTFEDVTDAAGVGVIENTACALFVDINNDGHQDLIVVRSNGPLLFLNDGTGKFRQKPHAFQFAQPPQGTFTGAAVADYDRDGWLDIYFCLYIYYQGAEQYKYPTPYFDANNGPPNFMMRNNRDGTFRDVTAETGLNQNNTRYSFCCAWNDFDNDGWPDLCVVNDFGRKNLYRNNGDGTFTDIAPEAGVADVGAGMSVCWLDYDNDGADDLYIANMWTAGGERITMQDEFKKNSPPEIRALYHKHAMGNSLFHNEAVGAAGVPSRPAAARRDRVILSGASAVLSAANAQSRDAYSQQTLSHPANRDASVSSVVKGVDSTSANASDQREETGFSDATNSSGVRIGRWSWSSDCFDFDHDGFPDLYITNGMVSAPNREDLNSFFWRQVVAKSPDQPQPSPDYEQGWAAINELIRADHTWSGFERNILYANNGDGTFSDVSGVIGLDFIEDSRSFAVADFDRDGRQEVFLKNRNAPQLRLLHNDLPGLPPSISFRLRGTKSNRDAIGAIITIALQTPSAAPSPAASSQSASSQSASGPHGSVETRLAASPSAATLPAATSPPHAPDLQASRSQTRSLQAGSGFLAQHSKDIFFGLGPLPDTVQQWSDGRPSPSNQTVAATIRWPSGLIQQFQNLPINHCVSIEEGAAAPAHVEPYRVSTPGRKQSKPQPPEILPSTVETWLLSPLAAPDFAAPEITADSPQPKALSRQSSSVDHPPPAASHSEVSKDPYPLPKSSLRLSAFRGQPVLLHFGAAGDPRTEKDWLNFSQRYASFKTQGLQLLSVSFAGESTAGSPSAHSLPFPILQGNDDVAAIYSILFRYLFDRHCDLALPASFLIDPTGDIVKIYQGAIDPAHLENDFHNIPKSGAERLARALPFPGVTQVIEFGRNYLSFGSVYFQRGYLDQSEAFFQLALRDNPESAEALYGIGSVNLNQERNAEARQYFERALTSRASYPGTLANSWNNLGLLAGREGRLPEAITDFQQALRLSPNHLIALVNLGGAYRQSKHWSDAQRTYEQALAIDPADADANYGLGMVYAQSDDAARAEDYLKRAIQLRPAYPEALNNLGILYVRSRRVEQAVAAFQQSIRMAPDFDQAYLNLARVEVIEGNNDQARAVLQELLKRHPQNSPALQMLSTLDK